MAVAAADLAHLAGSPVAAPGKKIRILLVHACPLYRVGLRSLLAQQDDCDVVGEAICLEDVLLLAGEYHPNVVLLDGSLTTTDPLDLVQHLRKAGVPGILVFAPLMGNEETLFRFLMAGATAYEDCSISGEELLVKLHRLAQGECLVTGDVLPIQAARRKRLARLRQIALRASARTDGSCPATEEEEGRERESASPLTQAERAVLEQIAGGATNEQTAQALGISHFTVKNRLDGLYRKLNVANRTAAVVMAIREGWMTVEGIGSLSL